MDISVGSQPTLGPQLVRVRDVRLTVPSAAGPVNILNGIDLDVGQGEAVGIVGPSGSGKTSLLMVLAGLEQATGGTVEVAGQALRGLGEDALARFRRDTCGDRVPGLPPDPGDDGAGERGGAAGAGGRARTPRRGRGRAWRRSGWGTG